MKTSVQSESGMGRVLVDHIDRIVSRICLLLIFLLIIGATSAQSPECSGFRTYTMGGWGANCNGNNPGCYLAANFQAAFGNAGLTIGCNNTLQLTTAQAVNDFLPSGSTAAALPIGALVNPGSGYSNVLAGQLVAVTLAVKFDQYDPNFSSNTMLLGDLQINFGPFAGMTVNNFLLVANQIIGGCGGQYSLPELNQAATLINQNFDNGNSDHGFLSCAPPPMEFQGFIQTNVRCYGESTGELEVVVSNGVPPYSYSWSNGGNGPVISGLSAGLYSVTVTDQTGYQLNLSESITQPDQLQVSFTNQNVSCNGGSNGSATANVSGGTAPYSYLWSNGSTNASISGLSTGWFVVTVTCSNQCSLIDSVFISEPDPLQLTLNTSDVNCNGGTDGGVTAQVSGGMAPYQFLWNTGATSPDLNSLSAGSYSLICTDANGCVANTETTVNQPDALMVNLTQSSLILCFGNSTGAIAASVSGGVGNYSYNWSNGASTPSVIGLNAGVYGLQLTDGNGCPASATIQLTQPPLLVAVTSSINISCFGAANGSASVSVSGGTGLYSYVWNTGASSALINNLAPGTYSVTVTDQNVCSSSTSATITQPAALTVSLSAAAISCYGGSSLIQSLVGGGTPGYQYNWDNSSVSGANSIYAQVGTHTLMVTDANGCKKAASIDLVLQSCSGFVTVTQGGWGAKCSGNNWGCYLDSKFAACFPNGLTIGSGTRMIKITNAAAIHTFLPNGGTSGPLAVGVLINPTNKTIKNTLAGQTAALTLNVAFDACNPSFASPSGTLGNLIVSTGPMAGMTVNQVLTEANKTLGGIGTYSADLLTSICDNINRNYDNGTVNLGFLACPCNTQLTAPDNTVNGQLQGLEQAMLGSFNSQLYPNPFTEAAVLRITTAESGKVDVMIYNSLEQLASAKSNLELVTGVNELVIYKEQLPAGIYNLQITSNGQELAYLRMIIR